MEAGGGLEVGGQVVHRSAQQRLQRAVGGGGAHRVRETRSQPADQLGEHGHRVAAQGRHRCVAGLAQRDQVDRERPLLADREGQRRTAVAEGEALAAALVDRHRRPDVGPVLEQPAHADVGGAVLLVGDRDEPQVAARPEPLPGQLRHRDGPGRDLVLHVDRAPAVEVAVVVDDRLERRVGPVAGVGRHDVGVTHERQRRRVRVGAGDPGHEVGPLRLPGHELGLDAGTGQVVAEVVRDQRLRARRRVVRGVEPDQVAGDLDRLVLVAAHEATLTDSGAGFRRLAHEVRPTTQPRPVLAAYSCVRA